MSRLLAIGTGPLLEAGVKTVGGHCLRTWHLVKPLIEQGHTVKLITLHIPDPDAVKNLHKPPEEKVYRGFSYTAFPVYDPVFSIPRISQMYQEFKPDCLLGINQMPSSVVCSLGAQESVWVDLNGYAMVEGQTKARLYDDDTYLKHFWEVERKCIRRADKFSTVSHPQLYALLGELAVSGRLNKHTFSYPFGCVIPNAVSDFFLEPSDKIQKALRGSIVPENAFVVLWSGGYNTWTDTETLLKALTLAMEKCPDLYFVSTGGLLYGHDEITYDRFKKSVEMSQYRERFKLLGWVDSALLPAYYRESNAGINIDSFNYETIFGARNRLTNMMAMGLPVITSRGTEISETIEEEGLGYTFAIRDAEDLSRLLIHAAGNREEPQQKGKKAREFALEHYSYHATTRALQEWAERPELSPDNRQRLERASNRKHWESQPLNEIEQEQQALADYGIQELMKTKIDLDNLRAKPLYKLYKFLSDHVPFKKR